MVKLTLIRPEPMIISVPLDLAVFCENCQTISNSRGDRCGVCESQAILALKLILDPEPQPPSPTHIDQPQSSRFSDMVGSTADTVIGNEKRDPTVGSR
jgi:hypothetical protein